jgi:hypothetical protein
MSKKDILCQYLKNFEAKCRSECLLSYEAACPVYIDFCDAAAKGKSFSEATVDISTGRGVIILKDISYFAILNLLTKVTEEPYYLFA